MEPLTETDYRDEPISLGDFVMVVGARHCWHPVWYGYVFGKTYSQLRLLAAFEPTWSYRYGNTEGFFTDLQLDRPNNCFRVPQHKLPDGVFATFSNCHVAVWDCEGIILRGAKDRETLEGIMYGNLGPKNKLSMTHPWNHKKRIVVLREEVSIMRLTEFDRRLTLAP